MRVIKTVIKIVVVLALLAVVGIVVLLGSMWLDHARETTLPTYWPVRGWPHDVRLERRHPFGPIGTAGNEAGASCLDLVPRSASTTVPDGCRLFTDSMADSY